MTARTSNAPVDNVDLATIDAIDAALAELSFTPSDSLADAWMQAALAVDERRIARTGTVYLLHFDRPYRHAAHYTGWTTNLTHRLAEHGTGHGARLLAVITAAGIGWQLARTWPDTTRTHERALKTQGGASRRCPLCGIQPRHTPPTTGGHQ